MKQRLQMPMGSACLGVRALILARVLLPPRARGSMYGAKQVKVQASVLQEA